MKNTEDLELVERALKRFRKMAQGARYGGMAEDHALAVWALDALGRIWEQLTEQQTNFLDLVIEEVE